MTSLPKKIDSDPLVESDPASNGTLDSEEAQRIRELVQEGVASGAPLPVDAEFFERLRGRVGKRS